MVKLVGVYQEGSAYRSNECKSRRYLPLQVEPDLTMVMALEEFCLACGPPSKSKQPEEVQTLLRNYNSLDKDELTAALMVTWPDILESLSQTISCVGCRRSVENLFNILKDCDLNDCSIDPLVLTSDGIMSISRDHLLGDPVRLANLLCHQVNRLHRQYVDGPAIKKSGSKKGGRCTFHTLDQKKGLISGSWLDCWEVMEPECKEEVVLLPFTAIRSTLDKYLKKHRFCCECATMINKAFKYLIEEGRDPAKVIKEEDGEEDSEEEHEGEAQGNKEGEGNGKGKKEGDDKGGEVAKRKKSRSDSNDESLNLFSGISSCVSDGHVHVTSNPKIISQLLLLAEPDLSGLDQERHAKNMDTALKEVLTCIGITLYNRFHKIQHKLREGEQTCDLLCLAALISLRRSLEISAERKRGITDLDALCFHIEQSDRDRERRQARKREKKMKQQQKKKDLKKKQAQEETESTNIQDSKLCSHEKVLEKQHRCNETKTKSPACTNQVNTSAQKLKGSSEPESKKNQTPNEKKKGKDKKEKKKGRDSESFEEQGDSDSGLSCVWSGEISPLYTRCEGRYEQGNWIKGGSPDLGLGEGDNTKQACITSNTKLGFMDVGGRDHEAVIPTSLEDLLEETEDVDEDVEDDCMFISKEEMIEFQSMFPHLNTQRQQLRDNLREKFAALCMHESCIRARKSSQTN